MHLSVFIYVFIYSFLFSPGDLLQTAAGSFLVVFARSRYWVSFLSIEIFQ